LICFWIIYFYGTESVNAIMTSNCIQLSIESRDLNNRNQINKNCIITKYKRSRTPQPLLAVCNDAIGCQKSLTYFSALFKQVHESQPNYINKSLRNRSIGSSKLSRLTADRIYHPIEYCDTRLITS
jgi:hypothetical protein